MQGTYDMALLLSVDRAHTMDGKGPHNLECTYPYNTPAECGSPINPIL